MGSDRIIETYIQRLRNWEAPMTADRLNALAEEVGLAPDDMAAVQQKAQDHLERGQGYLEFGRLDDAINELTQATSLDPLNFESLQSLTYAYDQRYGRHKKAADKKQAIALAKRCSEIRPDEPAMLISALEHDVNNRQRFLWLGLAILLVVIGFRPVMEILSTRSRVEQLTQDTALNSEPTAELSESQATESVISAEIDIPIKFEDADLTLDPRLSRLDNYEESSYYTMQGVLLNNGDQELDTLTLQVDYLDNNGVVLSTDSKEAIADNDAIVRPGDYHAFELIHKTIPDLAEVRLSVSAIESEPAPKTYTEDAPIKHAWSIKQPAKITFKLANRTENLATYDEVDKAFFNAEWAITNTGDTPIRKLKLKANFYNQKGQLLQTEDILPVYGSDAPMLPGETRPIQVNESIAKDYARYEVTVLEAE